MDTEKLRFAFRGSPAFGKALYRAETKEDSIATTIRCIKAEDAAPDEFEVTYRSEPGESCSVSKSTVTLGKSFWRLEDGDLIYIDLKHGFFEVSWRISSTSNSLLITELCNHRCVMCSQPPQDKDDLDWRIKFDFIADQIPNGSESFCITGGEPSLFLDKLVSPIQKLIANDIGAVSILSNGALISRKRIKDFASLVDPSKILWCVPLYSYNPDMHDKIVGSKGAWFKTLEGLENLHEEGFPIQIRFIPLSDNQDQISEYIKFVSSSLSFVQQLVFMGLEVTGYAVDNLSSIKPDYECVFHELQAVEDLILGMRTRFNIFNIPLCNLPEKLWDFSVKSISDWKNAYEVECEGCSVKDSCGGFFTTSKVSLFTIKPIH